MNSPNRLSQVACMITATALSLSLGCEEAGSTLDIPMKDGAQQGLWGQGGELTPAQDIAEHLKDTVQGVTAEQMDAMMRGHYRKLRLLDENDNWTVPRLDSISLELLPGDLDETKTFEFIDHMTRAAEANEYLTDFLARAQDEDLSELMSKIDEEGMDVLPDVIAYAHVLERLNRTMRDDWRVLDDCKAHWKKFWDAHNAYSYLDLFLTAKALSVKWPIGKLLDAHKAGAVAPDFMKAILPINIMEAVAVDLKDGETDNAYAGAILAKYPPGKLTFDPKTGEGPTVFSADGKAILLNMALPNQWAKLYAVWNLAFVTLFQDPYIFAKLLIPSVNDFEAEPAEYIYNRGMALFNHINFLVMRRIDCSETGEQEVIWPMDDVRGLWGTVNRDASNDYNKSVFKAKYPWMFWL